jgi:hypothetical protein
MRLNTFDDHIAVIAQEYIDLLPDNNHFLMALLIFIT